MAIDGPVMSPPLRDELTEETRYTIRVPDRWMFIVGKDAIADAKQKIADQISAEMIEQLRPQIAASLTPEAIGKLIGEGLVKAVADMFKERATR